MSTRAADLITLGLRIRHFRAERGFTLDQLGERVGMAGSQLSLIENGRRSPKLSTLQDIATAVDVELTDLLKNEAPNTRAALEIELERAQRNPLYGALGLPRVKMTKGMPMAALESLLGLHRELARRASEAIATPEEARRANTELRERMREQDNFMPDIEQLAEDRVRASGHVSGALTHREVSVMAEQLGFNLIYVNDLPGSTRSVTDLVNHRIYLPPASIPGGHGLRSMALQAMGHRLLGHERPSSYAEFLWQRLQINYFAAACLMPQAASVAFLAQAKRERELSVEDFRDAFGVTHEAAALRLTNLATSHLDMPLHFLRVTGDGALQKGYENDDLPLPADVTGSIEGQFVCKQWSARSAFTHTNRTTEFYQYTDTPAGTFWCATQTGATDAGEFSISVGVPFVQAKWFRGRETTQRAVSRCPDESCCRRPASEVSSRWAGRAWPSARLHAHVLSPLPSGTFPGVDDTEVYEFLEAHAAE
ncbi:helix-turn-helix domain-containing protein [Cryobacterium sinapicolor]|uniref:Helix-turn-helix domain-containing protein n=1 Tax=Cryobacterium sinapicolor TaxID=1259236 RepID=A0ABY2J7Q6_9MICO|nr:MULTISPECIES: helix-turn-helix domain-containing protein [Cryobacterium]TFC86176.1 helix-turn-helix domain-containing protein [Cryobacterium sp. TMT3-29-2]TFD00972.1 helix-turn-helix domain-containing protein [Cryobacterium sinapicolor]